MRIPEATLSEIQRRLDLAEVIGEFVPLSKRGGRYWGRCPFHDEKTPSFCVTPEKGLYYCFGCHKGGGLFQFVMEHEKLSFLEAVELLARKAGVEIPREAEEEQGGIKRETFLELNRKLCGSFNWLLMESPMGETARQYLARRGVSQEMIQAFQLGYAPPDRDWLKRFLSSKSYSEDFLARTGLFSSSSGRSASLFAHRIIFPITSARGEVVAFGGRALREGVPKYLNSPETSFFRKGENLFAADRALPAIRKAGRAVIVEGYMDVIAMHQAGIDTCVAPLGTALTEAQARLLKRYAQHVVLCFDGDEAGEKATLRAVEMLERQDLSVSIVAVQGGKDPADVLLAHGAQALKDMVESARPSFPFLLDRALSRFPRTGAEGKERIRDFLFPFIAAPASRIRADDYMKTLAEAIGAEEADVRADFTLWSKGPRMPDRTPREEPKAVSQDLFLMLVALAHPDLFPLVRTGVALADFEDPGARELFVALEEAFRAGQTGIESVISRLEDRKLAETAMARIASGEFDVNQERAARDGVKRIKQRTLRKKRDELAGEIRRAEGTGNAGRMNELLAEKMHLDGELARLSVKTLGNRGEQDTAI